MRGLARLLGIVAFTFLATSHTAATTTDRAVEWPPAPSERCPTSLQALVDAAPPGAVLDLPGCTYRETVTIDQPLTIRGTEGTEIRGSDVWTDWQSVERGWESSQDVPQVESGGECRPGTDRCHLPEQVFVDGLAQTRVAAAPGPGEFMITGDRRVILGQDPTGRLIEVSVRERWLQVSSSDVSVDSMVFRHAINGPQAELAALRVSDGFDRFRIEASHLFEAHGTLLGIVGGRDHVVRDSELGWAGQQGFGLVRTVDSTISGTSVHHNNTAMFDPAWEAGGGKASLARGLTFDGNRVSRNGGPGLWCDIDCQAVTFAENFTDHNENAGIMFEISSGATIQDNVVLENGWGHASGGWGAGILISSSGSVEVTGNILAWNADGITVINQGRSGRPADAGQHVSIEGNVVMAAPEPSDPGPSYLIAWLDDGSGRLYRPESRNHGGGNRYWFEGPETSADRFRWDRGLSALTDFAETPGGDGDRYLTTAERDAVILEARLTDRAEGHLVTEPISTRLRLALMVLGGLGAIAIVVVGLAVRRRRRIKDQSETVSVTDSPG